MFDMSWGEIMVIGGVALVVIGPKDLPRALRTLGQMTTKVRRLAGEFHSQFNEAMREAELEDVKKEVDGLNRSVASATTTAFNPIQTIRDELKSSIEGRAAPAVSYPDTSGPAFEPHSPGSASALPASQLPVSQVTVDQVPVAEPAADIYGLNPESQPLVPLPADEPAAHQPVDATTPAPDPHASDASPDPTRLVTGPGLEPVAEPEMPREARA